MKHPFIPKPLPRLPLFFQEQIEMNLIKYIKYLCYDLNMYVTDFNIQKDRVLYLNNAIKTTIDILRCETDDYLVNEMLDTFRHFILITNRSLHDFNLKVQIKVNDVFEEFSLREI